MHFYKIDAFSEDPCCLITRCCSVDLLVGVPKYIEYNSTWMKCELTIHTVYASSESKFIGINNYLYSQCLVVVSAQTRKSGKLKNLYWKWSLLILLVNRGRRSRGHVLARDVNSLESYNWYKPLIIVSSHKNFACGVVLAIPTIVLCFGYDDSI